MRDIKVILTTIIVLSLTISAKSQDSGVDEEIVIKEISTEKSYGFKKKKNIKVGSVSNEYAYIAQLTGPNGEVVSANRLGSCCAVKSPSAPFGKAPLDRWEIKYKGLKEPIIIYLNGYDYEQPKCPLGLNFKKL